MDITEITISKWESYQPRRDRANHTWFRVENTLASSETLHGLTADQRWFWICLLANASKKGSATVTFNWKYFATTFGVSRKKMVEALKSLEAHGAVTLSYGGTQTPDSSLQTDKQTDRQTDMPTVSAGFDFESVYSGYPRKEGKAEGMSRLTRRIKTADEFDRFSRAVRNYASQCRLQGKDQKYILKWSSFVGAEGAERWLDYVPQGTPSAPEPFPTPGSQEGGAFSEEPATSQPITRASSLPAEAREALRALTGGKAGA